VSTRNNLTRDEARRRAELVSDVTYRIHLDLTREEGFGSEATIRFRCSEPGGSTFLDLTASSVDAIELNGRSLPSSAYDGDRIALDGLQAENEVRVVARCHFNRTEVGMHRFVDPADDLVYLHTHLEPFGAHRVFACFDQPDLKAPFTFSATAPETWVVVSNAGATGPAEPAGEGTSRWTFQATPPMPAYITCLCAGPYHMERFEHRGIDLGFLGRQSLKDHMDSAELLEITKQGLDFFEPAFGYPYMWGGKYDQIFIPESNSGAMENAALVTFNDLYLFRSRVTDASRERRADTILHEMAHMWFGDLVTMRWWNDLWLNESFASFMAVFCQAEATRWDEAWTTFADAEKTWALRQDQLPTTHPIVAEVPDIESIHLNFDGITYAKGASVLRQLVAWVGRDAFLDGIKDYCRAHEFGNATLDDFLAALEASSGRDLHAWSKEWLETAGVNTLRPDFATTEGDQPTFASFSIVQEAAERWPTLRRHRIAVGLFDREGGRLVRRRIVEFDVRGERTEVPELVGERAPELVLLNDGDLTFAKVRLDAASLATVVEHLGELDDSLARALCWTACWDMTRDGEMRARDYVRLVVTNVDRETKVGVVQSLLAQAGAALHAYADPAHREDALQEFAEACLAGARKAEAASDHQLAWTRAFVANARSEDHLALVRRLLDGGEVFDGLTVDTELRWHIVRSLAASGAADDALIDAEFAKDRTDRGHRHAEAARAGRPDEGAKARAWEMARHAEDLPLALVDEVMASFQQYGQEDLLVPYAERFFRALDGVWAEMDLPDALAFGRRMYPFVQISQETVQRTDEELARTDLPGPLRRLLLEGKDGIERALRAREADAAEG
jgi:aminopeptidase N